MDHLANDWMRQAFEEAILAVGYTRPNPAVGALIVRDGRLVGRGRTQPPGQHHAEIMALNEAGELARGADLYVTLEPCCHYGRTPPCTDAIIRAGIARVFISVLDQNPRVNGGGYRQLTEAGIDVRVGIMADYGEEFYLGFHYWIKTGRPWVDVKIAQSLDGFIGGPRRERIQISGESAYRWVHHLRARVDLIAVGGGTAIYDDPELTVRAVQGNNPRRLIVNGDRILPEDLKLFDTRVAETRVFSRSPQPHLEKKVPVVLWKSPRFAESWLDFLRLLGEEGVHRILFELGGTMARLMLPDHRLWNRLFLLTGAKILGEGLAWSRDLTPSWKNGLQLSRFEAIGCDFLTVFEHVHRDHPGCRCD